jgi:large subunit ribosomal protein L1
MVSARKLALDKEVDSEKLYEPAEAIALLKKVATAKFVETAEIHGNLNLDPKYNDQQIRTTVALPHGTGKSVRVAVLAEGPAAAAAEEAGADLVGMADLIETISSGVLDFDVLLATPPAMPKLAKLGKVLGPKGLMPSPKAGTVSASPGDAVKEFKAGKMEFRTDKQGIVHVPFGKTDFSETALQGNLEAITTCIEKNRPTGCKGKLWNTATITSTMGPAIKLDVAALRAFTASA